MTTHLSARLTWHDTAWNGKVCRHPATNAACMEQEHVREGRKLAIEVPHAGCGFDTLKRELGYLPPCQRDTNAFGESGYVIRHIDPLPERGLPPVDEEVPPYSVCPTPYRWMLESNFHDICAAENLQVRGPQRENPGTWIQEDFRQRDMLEHFWSKLERGKSLVFFYCNRGNAVDDNASRLLVGVARIRDVSKAIYFGTSTKTPGRYPVWSRRVTHAFPKEGVRIPYQEYIEHGLPVESIACRPPAGLILPFSYVAEHLTDGHAVSTLLSLISTMEHVKADFKEGRGVAGEWDQSLAWLNDMLDEVWSGRGAFPGIGSLLCHLQFAQGISYHATVLRKIEQQGENPWAHLRAILERIRDPEPAYAAGLLAAADEWRKLRTSHPFLESLIRYELTTDQFNDIVVDGTRKARGIASPVDQIINNPYLLFEQDCGTATSVPVSLDVIDQGMMPEGDAARFRNEPPIAPNDRRRVRATMRAVLREAADGGDTVLPFNTLIARTSEYHPESRRCTVNGNVVWDSEDRQFHEQILWLNERDAPERWKRHALVDIAATDLPEELAELQEDFGEEAASVDGQQTIRLAALKRVRRCEIEIKTVIEKQAGLLPSLPASPDWKAILTSSQKDGGFGQPKNQREQDAIAEKITALDILYRHRLSVLTGGAGTGKTSVLNAFLRQLEILQGLRATILAAPTGKARMRLQSSTKRPANTIHQILHDAGMLGPNYRLLEAPTKGKLSASTVVVDESSMPSVELLAALFKAVDIGAVDRLIFVGDPFQLPPIGPGRPFIDIIQWLKEHHSDAVAELRTCMRVEIIDGEEIVSAGLQLANAYRDDPSPGDDRIASEAARLGKIGDLTLMTWRDHDDLQAKFTDALKILGIPPGDTAAFDRSLGITSENWEKSEAWQILSPTRIHAFGTDEINRLIHDRYRDAEIALAVDPRNRWPQPMGDQDIVYHDKVIQAVNMPKWQHNKTCWGFVANGEIGIVTQAWKKRPQDKSDNAFVAFSTQPDIQYRYTKFEVKDYLELAYAITVHKAQGSDFEDVIFVLPREAQTLTRELLYTALTRFRRRLVILLEGDTGTLDRLRNPAYSETARRSTFMFDLLLGDTSADIALPAAYRPEGLLHRAEDGTKMRSKSEVIVYEVLKRCGLSPHYEERLYAADGSGDYRLPDFTIRHGGRTWYWEHLGMLSKQSYKDDWENKVNWYRKNGYYDSVLTSRDHLIGNSSAIHADEIRETALKYILK